MSKITAEQKAFERGQQDAYEQVRLEIIGLKSLGENTWPTYNQLFALLERLVEKEKGNRQI